MVGNDIVDIAYTKNNSNWERPRFLEKLFTPIEQQLIYSAKMPSIMVWRLWSMKEAAYKLYTQINPSRFYNPKGFECEINNTVNIVRFTDFTCYVETKTTSDYIISEARLDTQLMTSKVIKLTNSNPKTQSKIIREKTIDFVANQLNKSKKDIKILSSEFGVPIVKIDSKELSISLSHHGHYGAFAIT